MPSTDVASSIFGFWSGTAAGFSTEAIASGAAVFSSLFFVDFLGLVEESMASKSILESTFGTSNSGAAIFEISTGDFPVPALSDFAVASAPEDLASAAF